MRAKRCLSFIGRVASAGHASQYLYHMEPPLEGNDYVIVSTIKNSEHEEALIFPSNGETITDYKELEGSLEGTTMPGVALVNAGYAIAKF